MLKPMNVLDAGLLMMDSPETPMNIGGIQVLRLPRGAPVDHVRRICEQARGFAATGAPFNYRLAAHGGPLGLPAWEVLDEVDLDQHVVRHALPWPGGEAELMALVSRLNAGMLDRSRPLWEQHYIEGLAGNRYATFTRIHHALMDGQWGMRLAQETSSADARRRGLPPYWAVRFDEPAPTAPAAPDPQAGLGWWERQRRGYRESVATAAGLRRAFGRLIESFRHPRDDGLAAPYTAPTCRLNGRLTPRRDLAVQRLDLERIKALAHANDATVNEVVLTLCGASLRRYLLQADDLPERPLIASMPIAQARPAGEAGGNSIVTGMVSLATHVEDPAERFRDVRGSSRQAKELFHDMPSTAALSIYLGVTGLPFILAQAAGATERVHAHNVVISNVPGPRQARYVNGARIEAEIPLSLLVPGQAMNITVISHEKWLDVAVLVCPDLAPRPQRVAEGIAQALPELEHALRPRRRSPSTARDTRRKATRKTTRTDRGSR